MTVWNNVTQPERGHVLFIVCADVWFDLRRGRCFLAKKRICLLFRAGSVRWGKRLAPQYEVTSVAPQKGCELESKEKAEVKTGLIAREQLWGDTARHVWQKKCCVVIEVPTFHLFTEVPRLTWSTK